MPAHRNITLDENLYRKLKARTRPKALRAFTAEAANAWPGATRHALDQAYGAASREGWRGRLAHEWTVTEMEAWPE